MVLRSYCTSSFSQLLQEELVSEEIQQVVKAKVQWLFPVSMKTQDKISLIAAGFQQGTREQKCISTGSCTFLKLYQNLHSTNPINWTNICIMCFDRLTGAVTGPEVAGGGAHELVEGTMDKQSGAIRRRTAKKKKHVEVYAANKSLPKKSRSSHFNEHKHFMKIWDACWSINVTTSFISSLLDQYFVKLHYCSNILIISSYILSYTVLQIVLVFILYCILMHWHTLY